MKNHDRYNRIVLGALFDFMGYITSRDKALTVGGKYSCTLILDAYREWIELRNIDEPIDIDVMHWQDKIETLSKLEKI